MSKRNMNLYMKSRWDARFLINTIMGLLAQQRKLYPDVILAIVTSAIRSYSRGYSGKMNKVKEQCIYQALKDYAEERVIANGKDSSIMERFVTMVTWAELEGEVCALEFFDGLEKPSASFPMDVFNSEEIDIITNESWERFRGKFYMSDGPPEKGLLVFEDNDCSDTFRKWMDEAHSDLVHQTLEDEESDSK